MGFLRFIFYILYFVKLKNFFTSLILLNLVCQYGLLNSFFVEDAKNDIYFQIIDPECLRYTFKAKQAKNFGVPFNETLKLIPLKIVEPNDACSSLINKIELRNNVGLIERGGCTFLDKCIEAEKNNLKAILIYDNDVHEDQYLDMITDSTKRNCSISAAFILGKDGDIIRRQMTYLGLERLVINIPVNINEFSTKKRDEL